MRNADRNEHEREMAVRLVTQGEAEREFDDAFWRAMTGEQRVELLWDMVREVRAIKGIDGDEPRLQRHVARLVRR